MFCFLPFALPLRLHLHLQYLIHLNTVIITLCLHFRWRSHCCVWHIDMCLLVKSHVFNDCFHRFGVFSTSTCFDIVCLISIIILKCFFRPITVDDQIQTSKPTVSCCWAGEAWTWPPTPSASRLDSSLRLHASRRFRTPRETFREDWRWTTKTWLVGTTAGLF